MRACAIYSADGGEPCEWCRLGPDDHELFWCGLCGGWGSVPDPTDRASRSLRMPVWAWRRLDCSCRSDEFGVVRRGGVVDRDGVPVSDERQRAAGLLRDR